MSVKLSELNAGIKDYHYIDIYYDVVIDVELSQNELMKIIHDYGDFLDNLIPTFKSHNLLTNPIKDIDNRFSCKTIKHLVLLYHEEYTGDLLKFIHSINLSVLYKRTVQKLFIEYDYVNESNYKLCENFDIDLLCDLYENTKISDFILIIFKKGFCVSTLGNIPHQDKIFNFCVHHDLYRTLVIDNIYNPVYYDNYYRDSMCDIHRKLIIHEFNTNGITRMRFKSEYEYHLFMNVTNYKLIFGYLKSIKDIFGYLYELHRNNNEAVVDKFINYLRKIKFTHKESISNIIYEPCSENTMRALIQMYDGEINKHHIVTGRKLLFRYNLFDDILKHYGDVFYYSEEMLIHDIKYYDKSNHDFFVYLYNKLENKSCLNIKYKYIYDKLSCSSRKKSARK